MNILSMTGQLIAILNPIGAIPTLSIYIINMEQEQLRRVYRLVGISVPLLMVIFAVGGRYILQAFGVNLDAFRIAGGVLLMGVAMETLMAGGPRAVGTVKEPEEFVLVPIVTPLLVGPGTITELILFSALYPIYEVLIAALLSSAFTYVVIRFSQPLLRKLGSNTLKVLGRFMSLIIAALAIGMILTGVTNYIESLHIA
ncbi:MarC family protein [Vulcanisaeta sp. JCM 14467]|uniref:MarC family protein n=1 Tax=Vulcanisaeta sp. JCM 14467 TaxID=1295370 RepID=UPI00209319B2|nr:MarC family protein [Vulcanisaeta sp. JCM 14467]